MLTKCLDLVSSREGFEKVIRICSLVPPRLSLKFPGGRGPGDSAGDLGKSGDLAPLFGSGRSDGWQRRGDSHTRRRRAGGGRRPRKQASRGIGRESSGAGAKRELAAARAWSDERSLETNILVNVFLFAPRR